jgi:hypothetical protein
LLALEELGEQLMLSGILMFKVRKGLFHRLVMDFVLTKTDMAD